MKKNSSDMSGSPSSDSAQSQMFSAGWQGRAYDWPTRLSTLVQNLGHLDRAKKLTICPGKANRGRYRRDSSSFAGRGPRTVATDICVGGAPTTSDASKEIATNPNFMARISYRRG